MRILGKLHDYYDSALAYGHDPSVVFERVQSEYLRQEIPTEYKFLSPRLSNRAAYWQGGYGANRRTGFDKNRAGTEFSYYPFTVAFCGKVYPGIEVQVRKRHQHDWDHLHFYDLDSYGIFLTENGLEFQEPTKHRKRWGYWSYDEWRSRHESPS